MNLGIFLLLAAPLPPDAPSLYRQGVDLFQQGRAAEAAGVLEQTVRLAPRDAQAWKVLGVVRASQGDYANAEPAFRTACSLNSRLTDACFYHARTLYLLNQFAQALATLGRLSADGRRHRMEALCLDALGRWQEAEPAYRKAVEEGAAEGRAGGSGAEDARIDYGVALARQGRAAEAVPLLELAVQRGPERGRAELELGRVLVELGRLQEARGVLERAVESTRGAARAHLLLGRVYARLGMRDAAEEHLRLGAEGVR